MHLRKAMLVDRWVQLLLVALVAVLLNLISARHFGRLDLTHDHIYTLSETSRKLMGGLEKPLYVKVYFTQNLDPPYNNHQQVVVDKLEEFRAYARGRMDVTVVDPTNDPTLEEEARRFGIESIRYTYRGQDRSELKRVFMGVSFVYGEKQAALEAVTQVDSVEYDVARTIRTLLSTEKPPTVGFTTGSGEVDLSRTGGPEEKLLRNISENYPVAQVPLGGQEGVPEGVKALIMLGPQKQVSERARYQMDQFLMKGGSLAIFLANVMPDTRTGRLQELYPGLEGFLASFGVQVNRDLVLDRKHNGRMGYPVRQGKRVLQALINTPLIPMITTLSKEDLIVRDLDQMLFPFASSLTVQEPLPDGEIGGPIAWASSDAIRVRTLRSTDPAALQNPIPGEEAGAWPMLVAVTGTFRSAYRDRSIPSPAAETPFGGAALASDDPASKVLESAPARLVVCGSYQMVLNNLPFMANLVDWMAQGDDLIGIRSKAIQLPPLKNPEAARLRWIKVANVLAPILILLVAGGIRWFLRRKTSYAMEVG